MTTKHGLSRHELYPRWSTIKDRCLNPKDKDYERYGGRGIKICNRWLDVNNFIEDMYDSYLLHVEEFGKKQTSIDRIDVNGNYEPSNCKWATYAEQNKNKRADCRWREFEAIDSNGNKYFCNNQKQFAKDNNLSLYSLKQCLFHGKEGYKGWKFILIK